MRGPTRRDMVDLRFILIERESNFKPTPNTHFMYEDGAAGTFHCLANVKLGSQGTKFGISQQSFTPQIIARHQIASRLLREANKSSSHES